MQISSNATKIILTLFTIVFGSGSFYFLSNNRNSITSINGNSNKTVLNQGEIKGDVVLGDKNTYNSTSKGLRPIHREETGRSMYETASGTYFFINAFVFDHPDSASPLSIYRTEVSSQAKDDFQFEIQKNDEDYMLIGYISTTDYSRLAILRNTTSTITLFRKIEPGLEGPISIPLLALRPTIRTRKLDEDDKSPRMIVLDIVLKGIVNTGAISHMPVPN